MNSPDIIFIVLDTQRADKLGCYGNNRGLSPNIDRFSEESILFEQAISPAQWTIPSHASFFTGKYPTAHRLTQSSQRLSKGQQHIAGLLLEADYETVGFCNNPLVGILDNDLKRGFQVFYNYGGAFPSLPKSSSKFPWPISRLAEGYTQFLRKISYPIQNFFGRSDLAFRLSLNAWMTPLWSRLANFKGQNERSVQDVVDFLQIRESDGVDKPLFLFLNLMETHLPFFPPGKFVDQVAPYLKENEDARTILRNWNREAYRWATPLEEPLGELENRVLHDMYDAEVAYQDDYLASLFEFMALRSNHNNTLTIIVADHGDGLGEHGYMGHAFVAYQELVHVPLILNWPVMWPTPKRIQTPVSTRRVFHTMFDAAGLRVDKPAQLAKPGTNELSLAKTISGEDPESETAYAEIYPPLNFVKAIEQRQPHLLESFRCLSEKRAVVGNRQGSIYKLIQVDDQLDELFDILRDKQELQNLEKTFPDIAGNLDEQLSGKVSELQSLDDIGAFEETIDLQTDSQLAQRLRGLGYLD